MKRDVETSTRAAPAATKYRRKLNVATLYKLAAGLCQRKVGEEERYALRTGLNNLVLIASVGWMYGLQGIRASGMFHTNSGRLPVLWRVSMSNQSTHHLHARLPYNLGMQKSARLDQVGESDGALLRQQ